MDNTNKNLAKKSVLRQIKLQNFSFTNNSFEISIEKNTKKEPCRNQGSFKEK